MASAKQRRTSRLSSTSSRREDSLGTDQQSPVAPSENTAPNGADQNDTAATDAPQLDWTKFKASFNIKHYPHPASASKATKKRKRGPAPREPLYEENEFDKSLSTLYTVEPAKWWEDTRRYRKFTIANETFRLGDTVWVKPDDSEAIEGAPLNNWVAKVLEVRAASEQHVFLRVFWMYRPEDLPGGRRSYHGRNEVIASNTMQIIDALTVNGKASVQHWKEDDNEEILDADQLFWRQTLDCPDGGPTGVLSELRKHCVDEAPFNPDTLLIHCDACDTWLHGQCLENEAIRQAHKENDLPEAELVSVLQMTAEKAEPAPNGEDSSEQKEDKDDIGKKADPAFKADIKIGNDEKSHIVLRDIREGKEAHELEKEIRCLKCQALIE